jgi:hypothetical protein
MAYRILLRRDSSVNWDEANPVLLEGEPGYETDTGKMKIGDGSSTWSALDYYGGTGPAGPVGPIGPTGPSGTIKTPNYQTSSYTLSVSDSEGIVDLNSSSNLIVTVPLNSAEPLKVGTTVRLFRSGAGEVIINASSGATLRIANGYLNRLRERYSVASLTQISPDVWYLYGDLQQ